MSKNPYNMPDPDGWLEYRQLILAELTRLNGGIQGLTDKFDTARTLRDAEIVAMRVDIAMLKVRAGIVGAIGGSLGGAVIAALVIKLMK